LDFLLPL